jgi:ribose 5-phosphate isomerase A
MDQEEKKRRVAAAAIAQVEFDAVLGVGSGTTVHHLIEALRPHRHKIPGAVATSAETERRLRDLGIAVLDLNAVDYLPVYIDGADEANRHLQLIKGGGGALTREKICAQVAARFVCIIDDGKLKDRLGAFPLPVEVIPMARGLVARELVKLGGQPVLRQGFTTDNGNLILDVHHLPLLDPPAFETAINQIPGVVTNGIFARRPADLLLIASDDGVATLRR